MKRYELSNHPVIELEAVSKIRGMFAVGPSDVSASSHSSREVAAQSKERSVRTSSSIGGAELSL